MKRKVIVGIMTLLHITLAATACEKNPETSVTSDVPPLTGGETEPIPPGEMISFQLGVTPGTTGAANDDIVYPIHEP